MILQRLYELSNRLDLVGNPDFKKDKVDFILNVDEDGNLVQAISVRDEKGKATLRVVPVTPSRSGSSIRPGFLYDNTKYVLGVGSKDLERNKKTQEAFLERISDAADQTGDVALMAVQRFLEGCTAQRVEGLRQQLGLEKWGGDERFSFSYSKDANRPIHERDRIRIWLAQQRESDIKTANSVCLVTGRYEPTSRLHGFIKGMRVASVRSAGAPLISFNESSFQSHGLKQGENATVSREATDGYVAALNWLLARDGQRDHRFGIRTGETVTVFWTKGESEGPEILASIFDSADADEVRNLLKSAWLGAKHETQDTNAFYALTLGGNVARVVVREWMESSISKLQGRILQYFDDTSIIDDEPIPLRMLLESLKPPGNSTSLPPDVEAKMIRSAIFGGRIPTTAFHLALQRISVPNKKAKKYERRIFEKAHFALVKAYLIRSPLTTNKGQITVALDTENTNIDYNLGRLFAVLEYVQGQALGDVNATIRDKFFAAASSRPASVIPRLLSVSTHHESKLRKSGSVGQAVNLSKLKGEIMENFPATGFPSHLDLESQGRFAIGYYHQRQNFFKKRTEKDASTNDSQEKNA